MSYYRPKCTEPLVHLGAIILHQGGNHGPLLGPISVKPPLFQPVAQITNPQKTIYPLFVAVCSVSSEFTSSERSPCKIFSRTSTLFFYTKSITVSFRRARFLEFAYCKLSTKLYIVIVVHLM
jgi:hypothetical protein